jgi:hypothetical protein
VRVFFDTNVLVSAFLARGLCADLLRLVLTEHTLVARKGRLPAQILELGLVDADLFVTGDQGVLACSNPPLPLLNPRGRWEQRRLAVLMYY